MGQERVNDDAHFYQALEYVLGGRPADENGDAETLGVHSHVQAC